LPDDDELVEEPLSLLLVVLDAAVDELSLDPQPAKSARATTATSATSQFRLGINWSSNS
jgi:hypothetical protein